MYLFFEKHKTNIKKEFIKFVFQCLLPIFVVNFSQAIIWVGISFLNFAQYKAGYFIWSPCSWIDELIHKNIYEPISDNSFLKFVYGTLNELLYYFFAFSLFFLNKKYFHKYILCYGITSIIQFSFQIVLPSYCAWNVPLENLTWKKLQFNFLCFPSFHTSRVFTLVAFITIVFMLNKKNIVKILYFIFGSFYLIIILITIIVTGQHYFFDPVAAIILCLCMILFILKWDKTDMLTTFFDKKITMFYESKRKVFYCGLIIFLLCVFVSLYLLSISLH